MSRRKKIDRGEAISNILTSLAIDLAGPWVAMLWLGAAHSVDPRIPTVGYWAMLFLGFTFTALSGAQTFKLKEKQ